MWDAITTVIKMNDKVERMAATMVAQQQKIETALEIALSRGGSEKVTRQIESKS